MVKVHHHYHNFNALAPYDPYGGTSGLYKVKLQVGGPLCMGPPQNQPLIGFRFMVRDGYSLGKRCLGTNYHL
jgi:hypothetical protein